MVGRAHLVPDAVRRRDDLGHEAARLVERAEGQLAIHVVEAGQLHDLFDPCDVVQCELDVPERRPVVTHRLEGYRPHSRPMGAFPASRSPRPPRDATYAAGVRFDVETVKFASSYG